MSLQADFFSALSAFLPIENRLTDPGECLTYGYDNSRCFGMPIGVVFPRHHQDVVHIMKLCLRFNIPLVARGRGTSTTGSAVPLEGSLVLSTEKMDVILKIDPPNRIIVAQTGVTNQAIQMALEPYGFMWAPDPTSSAYCSLGGNLAVNAAGPRSVKYGTTHENTLGLRVVIGTGEDFYTGVYTTKGVTGYDLTRLIIGSEGTLAVITEATLKLTALPESKTTLQATYQSLEAATQAVANIMGQPILPCALEFIDKNALDLVRTYAELPLPTDVAAMLLIEVDGSRLSLAENAEKIASAAQVPGLLSLKTAAHEAEAKALWATRKALSPALRQFAPHKINEDVVVPVSQLPTLIAGLEQLSQRHAIPIVNFGHAGNGNLHVNLLFHPENPKQAKAAPLCLSEVFDLVLSLGGTLSGEHGIGLLKQDYISREISPSALNLMRNIKKQFDPAGLLNPGKLFSNEKN